MVLKYNTIKAIKLRESNFYSRFDIPHKLCYINHYMIISANLLIIQVADGFAPDSFWE